MLSIFHNSPVSMKDFTLKNYLCEISITKLFQFFFFFSRTFVKVKTIETIVADF